MNRELTPVDWAKRPIAEKYADFSGRAPRAEYWWYVLALVVAYIVVGIIESIVGIHHMILYSYGPLSALLWLATLVPSLAVAVRRLHDTGKSGWWMLLPIVPYCIAAVLGGAAIASGAAAAGSAGLMAGAGIAGIFVVIGLVCALVLLWFMVQPGTAGANRYGPDPYDAAGVTTAAAG